MARYEIEPERSTVHIDGSSSIHPIRAQASGLTGWFELASRSGQVSASPNLSGEVSIPVSRLRSGNPLVDRETRRRIDAAGHPDIAGVATSSERIDPATVALNGTIAFRGEVRAVQGTIQVKFDGAKATLTGSATFDVRDWELRLPRLGLIRVHPDVTVSISLTGTKL